jgi:hypothetical protein
MGQLVCRYAAVLNRMEPGFFEQDKAGGPRRSARNRTKRA